MKNVATILAAVFSIGVGAQAAGEMPPSRADTKAADTPGTIQLQAEADNLTISVITVSVR